MIKPFEANVEEYDWLIGVVMKSIPGWMVYKMTKKGLMDDLLQEGRLGVLRAAKSFNPQRGVKFPTYASFWIRSFLTRYTNKMFHPINMPDRGKIELGFSEIFEETLVTNDLNENELSTSVRQIVNKLPEQHRELIISRWGLDGAPPQSNQEIGDAIGLTRQAIDLRYKKAVANLKKIAEDQTWLLER